MDCSASTLAGNKVNTEREALHKQKGFGPSESGLRGSFEHRAFIYSSVEEFLSFMLAFVREGLANKEPVLLAVDPELIKALQAGLGADVDSVRLMDTREWFPRSARRLRAFYELIHDEFAMGAERVWLVGESAWASGSSEMIREWQRYESAVNEILKPFPATLVCTYNASRLEPSIIETALRTHPHIHRDGAGEDSPFFVSPEEFLREWSFHLDRPPANASRISEFVSLAEVRQFIGEHAIDGGMNPARATDLLIAANEILTNAISYGNGIHAVSVWLGGDHLICQIEDRGPGFDDPFTSYRPPAEDPSGGRGLWLARQLVDLLQIASGPHGTIVRTHMKVS